MFVVIVPVHFNEAIPGYAEFGIEVLFHSWNVEVILVFYSKMFKQPYGRYVLFFSQCRFL